MTDQPLYLWFSGLEPCKPDGNGWYGIALNWGEDLEDPYDGFWLFFQSRADAEQFSAAVHAKGWISQQGVRFSQYKLRETLRIARRFNLMATG